MRVNGFYCIMHGFHDGNDALRVCRIGEDTGRVSITCPLIETLKPHPFALVASSERGSNLACLSRDHQVFCPAYPCACCREANTGRWIVDGQAHRESCLIT